MLYGDPAFTLGAPQQRGLDTSASDTQTPDIAVNHAQLPIQIEPYVSHALHTPHAFRQSDAKPIQQPKSRLLVLLFSLALVLLVALGYGLQSVKTPPLLHPSSLLVMKFEPLRLDARLDWMGEGIRQSLNAQLSRYPDLKVYSKEHLYFLRSEQPTGGLAKLQQFLSSVSSVFVLGQAAEETDMAVAKRLGIPKIIAGSFVILGTKLRIEAHIIGTKSGVQEASSYVEGDQYEEHFFQLTQKLANKIADHLALSRTRPADVAPQAETPNAKDLRMLLEAEGEVPSVRQPHTPAAPDTLPQSQHKPQDQSSLFSDLGMDRRAVCLGPRKRTRRIGARRIRARRTRNGSATRSCSLGSAAGGKDRTWGTSRPTDTGTYTGTYTGTCPGTCGSQRSD